MTGYVYAGYPHPDQTAIYATSSLLDWSKESHEREWERFHRGAGSRVRAFRFEHQTSAVGGSTLAVGAIDEGRAS